MPKTNEEPIHVWLRNSNCEQVVERKLTYLRPDPRFVRKYDRRLAQLFVGALLRHGKTHPALLVNKRKIVAGLGHIEGSKKLGGSRFPTIDVELLNKHELQRWVTTIRNLAKREAWPRDILSIEFQVLAEMNLGFDLNFGGVELARTDPA
jgi:hypothetical protein